MTHTTLEDATSPRPNRRQIGAIGTWARIAVGTGAIAVPIALAGFGWWEAAVSLVGLPLATVVATPLVTAIYRRIAPGTLASRHRLCALPACTLICVMVAVNSALVALTSANGNVTISVWLGASMLLAAARGYGGCEVLAVWNLFSGRSDEIGCLLYTPIDRAEARRRRLADTR